MMNTTSSNTASTTALLAVDDLAIHVGGRALLQGISFRLHAGEALSLVGESGAGKSLLAQAIMGNLPPALRASGSITIDGVTTRAEDAASRRALWGRKLALLPQEPTVALNPLQRVAPQLAEVYTLLHGQPQGEAAARAQQELARAGLGQATAHYPWQLSGGMAQRAVAAITLAGGAPVLMVDEPTKGLDNHWRDRTVEVFRSVLQAGGCLLAITHDMAVAQALGGQVIVLRHGQAVEQGAIGKVAAQPQHPFTRQLMDADPARWLPFAAPQRASRWWRHGAFPKPTARSSCLRPWTCRSAAANAWPCKAPAAPARARWAMCCWACCRPTLAAWHAARACARMRFKSSTKTRSARLPRTSAWPSRCAMPPGCTAATGRRCSGGWSNCACPRVCWSASPSKSPAASCSALPWPACWWRNLPCCLPTSPHRA